MYIFFLDFKCPVILEPGLENLYLFCISLMPQYDNI